MWGAGDEEKRRALISNSRSHELPSEDGATVGNHHPKYDAREELPPPPPPFLCPPLFGSPWVWAFQRRIFFYNDLLGFSFLTLRINSSKSRSSIKQGKNASGVSPILTPQLLGASVWGTFTPWDGWLLWSPTKSEWTLLCTKHPFYKKGEILPLLSAPAPSAIVLFLSLFSISCIPAIPSFSFTSAKPKSGQTFTFLSHTWHNHRVFSPLACLPHVEMFHLWPFFQIYLAHS